MACKPSRKSIFQFSFGRWLSENLDDGETMAVRMQDFERCTITFKQKENWSYGGQYDISLVQVGSAVCATLKAHDFFMESKKVALSTTLWTLVRVELPIFHLTKDGD